MCHVLSRKRSVQGNSKINVLPSKSVSDVFKNTNVTYFSDATKKWKWKVIRYDTSSAKT